jgi:hypothetical protein
MPLLFAMLTQLTGTGQFKTKLTLALAEKHSYKGFEMYLYIFGALGYFSQYRLIEFALHQSPNLARNQK